MLVLNQASFVRGSKILLENASLRVFPQHKVALIGANGCGKSSLFQLFLGKLHLEAGDIEIPKSWRIAHMAQEVVATERSALDYVLDGHHSLRKAQQQAEEAEKAKDNHRLIQALDQLDTLKAYEQQAKAEQLLSGLGFTQSEFHKSVKHFSGGWRIRLNLAQALIQPSDLLLLDEPTNHLDLDATLWLEQWLKSYQGTLLLISHDRDVIDSICNRIVHIEGKQLNLYTGHYSDFERARAQKLALNQSLYEKQQQKIAHMQDFVRRFRAKASKAKQAQSRIKALEKMELIQAAQADNPFEFHIPCYEKLSEPLLALDEAVLGYETSPILKAVNCSLYPGVRVGLLGANGAGKSTFIKTLAGNIHLLKGQRTEGEHLKIGYFAQHQLEALDMNASPLVLLQRLTPEAKEQYIRNFLGGYGFRGDQAVEACSPFSGGEKARLALALVAWQKPNLLLMDEPTNHLDIEMRQALIQALLNFEGAVVVISHDRHLLSQIVDQFWLIDGGAVQEFSGDLTDYQNYIKKSSASTSLTDQSFKTHIQESRPSASMKSSIITKTDKQKSAELRTKLSPLTKQVKDLEESMVFHESNLAHIEARLANSELYESKNKPELQKILKQQIDIKQSLERDEKQWLKLQERIEDITNASN